MTINEEEPSPSMSTGGRPTAVASTTTTATTTNSAANDDNCDGPLLATGSSSSSCHPKKDKRIAYPARNILQSSAMLLHQDNWRKAATRVKDHDCDDDEDDYDAADDDDKAEKRSQRHIWRLCLVLGAVALCNLALNAAVLMVLRVSQGMEAIELIRERDLIKFHGNTDLDRVCLQRGVCEGFGDEPIQLIGDAAGVNVRVANKYSASAASSRSSSSLNVLKNGTAGFANVRSLEIREPRSGRSVFSSESPSFELSREAGRELEQLQAELAQTHRVAAPKRRDLRVLADRSLHLHGAEGASLDAKEMAWLARGDITLRSREGDLVLEAGNGIEIPNLPVAPIHRHPPSSSSSSSSEARDRYKVCVCMPDGKLFLVPARNKGGARLDCAAFVRAQKSDPCAM
ncbi:uncharacterized protein LOC106654569 [Trichogramma pretiosum]|uniref:uncharacterized protein LOC106654569 n=1 Tax=Trichogramma pretiosum TaxID=7493 RepID=UPI0006C9B3DE|nr:uncharacterized protein LOC106654569 [Trichogramma pretiosum]